MSHHWVELMKRIDDSLDLFYSLALSVSKLLDVFLFCRNELMKRRIQETDCYRVALESLEQTFEVFLLILLLTLRKQLSLVLKVSVFAVQSICSSVRDVSMHSVR